MTNALVFWANYGILRFFQSLKCFLFLLQLAQRKIRDILTQVKQQQKGGMGGPPAPNPQAITELTDPQGLAQEPKRKWHTWALT